MPRGKAPCRRHVYRRWCGAETIPRKMGMPIQAATILGFGSPHMCNHGVKLTKSFKVIPTPRLQCKSFPYLITHLYLAATEVTSMYSISAYSKSSCPQGGFALSAVEKSERERERVSQVNHFGDVLLMRQVLTTVAAGCGGGGGGHACTARVSGG